MSAELTFLILLHIESSQKHDSLLAKQSSVTREGTIDSRVRMNIHDSSTASEAVVQAAKVHSSDTILSES